MTQKIPTLPPLGRRTEEEGDCSLTSVRPGSLDVASKFLLRASETSLPGRLAPSSEKDINLPLFALTYVGVNEHNAEVPFFGVNGLH